MSLRTKSIQDRQKRDSEVRVGSGHYVGACLCLFFQKLSKRTVSKYVSVICLGEQ